MKYFIFLFLILLSSCKENTLKEAAYFMSECKELAKCLELPYEVEYWGEDLLPHENISCSITRTEEFEGKDTKMTYVFYKGDNHMVDMLRVCMLAKNKIEELK